MTRERELFDRRVIERLNEMGLYRIAQFQLSTTGMGGVGPYEALRNQHSDAFGDIGEGPPEEVTDELIAELVRHTVAMWDEYDIDSCPNEPAPLPDHPDALGRDRFVDHVVDVLDERGEEEAGAWARENHHNPRALGPVEVAFEEDLALRTDSVEAVADAVLAGFSAWKEAQP